MHVILHWLWAASQHHYDETDRAVDCLCNFAIMRSFLVRSEELFKQTVNALQSIKTDLPHPLCAEQSALRHIQIRLRLSLPADANLLPYILNRVRARNDQQLNLPTVCGYSPIKRYAVVTKSPIKPPWMKA